MDRRTHLHIFRTGKLNHKLLLILFLAFLLIGSLIVADKFIMRSQSRKAEEFLAQIISSISSNSDDYKNHCDDENVANIEANKNIISNNYEILSLDRDNNILWWRLTGEEFRYQVLFVQQYICHIAIGNFPDGEFKIYDWSRPYDKSGNRIGENK